MRSTGETIVMLITIMIVMAMGNFVAQTQAQDTLSFRNCYPGCIDRCAIEKQLPKLLLCPFTCILTCLAPPTSNIPPSHSQIILAKKIDHTDYFCKLSCATHHCASLSSLRNPSKFFFFLLYENILLIDNHIYLVSYFLSKRYIYYYELYLKIT